MSEKQSASRPKHVFYPTNFAHQLFYLAEICDSLRVKEFDNTMEVPVLNMFRLFGDSSIEQ
jgi:hypothetical protein